MSKDILIIVDCNKPVTGGQLPSDAVSMYASDRSIVRNNSQGSTELWVQVPPETNLRWRAVPLQLSEGLPEDQRFQVMITQVKLWGANGNQLDASQYLQVWFADAGTSNGPAYNPSPNSFSFSPANPPPSGSSNSNAAGVEMLQIKDPFVQATCFGEMQAKNYISYSFTCTVYKSGKLYATVSWDPYVTITPS
jgi:hypothetical protein